MKPLQRIALQRAYDALEAEARAHYERGDIEADAVAHAFDSSMQAHFRRRRDAEYRRARGLQLTASELSAHYPEADLP